jgi:peptidoglycan/LPS O-acetylase OafA/YrhL
VISGFIIPYSMFRGGYVFPRHFGTFVLKRVIRLDPPYIAMIGATIVLAYASAAAPGFRGHVPTYSATQVASHLGYLTSWMHYPWVNPVFWSLAIEFQFYLAMAVLVPLLTYPYVAVRIATVLIGCTLSVAFLGHTESSLVPYLGLFTLGISTFQWRCNLTSTPQYAGLMTIGVTSVVLTLGTLVAAAGIVTALVIGIARPRRNAVLTWFGAISYSLYLVHVPIGGRVVNLGTRLPATVGWQLAVLAAAVGVSVVASWWLYLLVEAPVQRWSALIRYASGAHPAGSQSALTATDDLLTSGLARTGASPPLLFRP